MSGKVGELFSRRAIKHVLVQLGQSLPSDGPGVDVLISDADSDRDGEWSVYELDQLLQSLAGSKA
eukprot:CAMPEP_0174712718 /NCGR_PEP_ID=MMETSP1094-20130205/13629_1 /TAXON_ID=156173 /ORGANISM="Chrysochromulina brevifilum, Strain UTEX LB 985" /LENGTH=64 /DNA_ID=CAMNT_0015911815 /DNA_START=69 /DNA_END=259 /DNA_ORIENTATION=-